MQLFIPGNFFQKHIQKGLFLFLFIGIGLFFIPHHVIAQQDSIYTIKAKEILSQKKNVSEDKLKVENERETTYPYSGKKVHSIKFIDTTGNGYPIILDDKGKELNHDDLVTEDLAAKHAKYGKFEPSFAEKLEKEKEKDKTSEDKPVKAIIWLTIPHFEPYPKPYFKKETAQEEIQEYSKKINAYVISKTEPAVTKIKEKLKQLGYDALEDTTVGSLIADIPPKVLKEIETWEEIDELADGNKKEKPMLETAGYSTGAYWVNGRGINGSGVQIAQIETLGGRIALNNPYISTTNIIQDTTYLGYPCDKPNLHATAVAGAMKSIHNPHRGHSQGISLWAGGSCNGYDTELHNRAAAAVTWGAQALNLSFGCDGGVNCNIGVTDDDKYYDKIVFNNYRSIIVAAGNNGRTINGSNCSLGGDETDNIYSPGLGYNSITVGAYYDNDTWFGSDDTLYNCSSWKNPSSYHGDREKPDIIAPGKNITTLQEIYPWIKTVTGTSIATPIVTAGVALMLQRDSSLYYWPEITKALTIATANKNLDGNIVPSSYEDSRDGFGAVNFALADDRLHAGSSYVQGAFGCGNTVPYERTMSLTQGYLTKVVLAYDADPDYPNYYFEPNMDLDLHIYDPNGNWVGGSTRYDSTVEAISFSPTMSGNYKVQMSRYHCDSTYNNTWFSIAWSQG